MSKGTCTAAGCDRSARSRGWCNSHYERWRKGRPTDGVLRLFGRAGCLADGCSSPHHSGGYCAKHKSRVKRHGDPDAWTRNGANHGMWVGNEAGYHGAHKRVYAKRGPAREHTCIDCGKPADQWSYNHKDSNSKMSPLGPFSLDVNCYESRCVSCHKTFDQNR